MFTGIALKIASAFVFTLMAAFVRGLGDAVPPGQIVFARSFFALIPLLIWLAFRAELRDAVRTRHPIGHVMRSGAGTASMFFMFAALARLPLPDATVIGYASPLITVVLAAVLLREQVRIYRWMAVVIGLLGVVVILWPHLWQGMEPASMSKEESGRLTEGAILALVGAFFTAFAMIQVRRLTQSESTASIVFFFSVFSSILGLLTLPWGWAWPNLQQGALLVGIGLLGGVGQILLTQSYRYADASLIAPFEYTTLLWSVAFGAFFGEIPGIYVLTGGVIVMGSGVFVILRERSLGIERTQARQVNPPPAA